MFSLFLTFFLVTLSHSARETIINSESGYVAAVVIDRLDPVIPGDLHALLEPYLRRLDAPEIEREHREERLARDGRPDDPRDRLDRRELADDRDDVDRDRLDSDRADGLHQPGPRPRRSGQPDRDRVRRDRVRGTAGSDRRDVDDRGAFDDDRDSAARLDSRRPGHRRPARHRADRDAVPRPGDPSRIERRAGDDPYSGDADRVARRRDRRRTDDRRWRTIPATTSHRAPKRPTGSPSSPLSRMRSSTWLSRSGGRRGRNAAEN